MLLRVPFLIDLRWKESEEKLVQITGCEARTAHYRFGLTHTEMLLGNDAISKLIVRELRFYVGTATLSLP